MEDLKFIGIGGAYAPDLGGNCAYIKDDKTLLLIDCCESATEKLKNRNLFDGVDNIVVAITHTHADHVAGLGNLIWYCNFILNIKTKIVSNSATFESHTRGLLKSLGVEDRFFDFVDPSCVVVGGCKIEMLPTIHTPILECFGVMFTDSIGKYYYTGDTKDFDNIKRLVCDDQVKRVYTETNWQSYNTHIEYAQLKKIKCDKLVLMHFEDVELYNLAISDGFNVAKL